MIMPSTKSQKKDCPICHRPCWISGCRVSPDGKSGFCKSKKRVKVPGGGTRREGGPWELKKVPVGDFKEGPLQHETIPERLSKAVGWTYEIVGHYIWPTLEQWELGFMRDFHMEQEIAIWVVIAGAFLTYHRLRNLAVRSDEEEKDLVGGLLQASQIGGDDPDAAAIPEYGFLRECLRDPDIPAECKF